MSPTLSGGCLCGAVRYRAEIESANVMHCFCKDCQRVTGSQAATFFSVPESAISIEGETGFYSKAGDSGREVGRYFCPRCGSQLYSRAEVAPGALFVKIGTLDDSSALTPQIAIWTASKPAWADLPAGLTSFDRNPPR